jgi:hypothetical protein
VSVLLVLQRHKLFKIIKLTRMVRTLGKPPVNEDRMAGPALSLFMFQEEAGWPLQNPFWRRARMAPATGPINDDGIVGSMVRPAQLHRNRWTLRIPDAASFGLDCLRSTRQIPQHSIHTLEGRVTQWSGL